MKRFELTFTFDRMPQMTEVSSFAIISKMERFFPPERSANCVVFF